MDWKEFFELTFFALAGQVFYLLLKLKTACTLKEFTWTRFVEKNWAPTLASFWSIALVALLVASSDFLSDKIDNFEAVFIGWSGADFLKNLFKRKNGTI